MSVPFSDPCGLFCLGSDAHGRPCGGWTEALTDDEFSSVLAWSDALLDFQDKFPGIKLLSVRPMTLSQFEAFVSVSKMERIAV